jgi:DNA processing protein
MQNYKNLQTWLALNRLYNLSPSDIEKICRSIDNAENLLRSSRNSLLRNGFSEKLIEQIQEIDWDDVEEEIKWAEHPQHHIITLIDENYPKLLQEISDPPLVLFVKGDPELLQQPQLAMVGSRNPTPLGRETAFHFADFLAQSGLVITSGLALGIDGASHQGALKTGKTIAVLGTGLGQIYPLRHQKLAEQVAQSGAIISEFPLHTAPESKNFPRRNRLISGLSLGVLVIEAALRSGSLITARLAGTQGREIFAIPGSTHNPLAKGCHKLIKDGAKLVETAEDILSELQIPKTFKNKTTKTTKPKLDPEYKKLLSCIGHEPTAIDTLISRTNFSAQNISSMLLIMELEGHVKSVAGGYIKT